MVQLTERRYAASLHTARSGNGGAADGDAVSTQHRQRSAAAAASRWLAAAAALTAGRAACADASDGHAAVDGARGSIEAAQQHEARGGAHPRESAGAGADSGGRRDGATGVPAHSARLVVGLVGERGGGGSGAMEKCEGNQTPPTGRNAAAVHSFAPLRGC